MENKLNNNPFKIGDLVGVPPKMFDDDRCSYKWSNTLYDKSKHKKLVVGYIIEISKKGKNCRVLWSIDYLKTWMKYSYLIKLSKNINIIKGITFTNSIKINNEIISKSSQINEREEKLSGQLISKKEIENNRKFILLGINY